MPNLIYVVDCAHCGMTRTVRVDRPLTDDELNDYAQELPPCDECERSVAR